MSKYQWQFVYKTQCNETLLNGVKLDVSCREIIYAVKEFKIKFKNRNTKIINFCERILNYMFLWLSIFYVFYLLIFNVLVSSRVFTRLGPVKCSLNYPRAKQY